MLRKILLLAAMFVAVPYVLNQVRKPTKWVGRFFTWTMNLSHSALTNWGLRQVAISPAFAILDVGCGGGRTVKKLAALADAGHVAGIDFATGSVDASRATNKTLIADGRVEIRQASVAALPFADATFDLVTAFETHYYWPDLAQALAEIRRVTKPGGTVLVVAETYRRPNDFAPRLAMGLLRAKHLSADEHRDWFVAGGLTDVRVIQEHGWIAVTGHRPA